MCTGSILSLSASPSIHSLIDGWLTNRWHTIESPRAKATRGQTSVRLNLVVFHMLALPLPDMEIILALLET